VKAVEALTDAIQWGMEAEVVHVARIDESRLVSAVQELYRGELVRELKDQRGLAERQTELVGAARGGARRGGEGPARARRAADRPGAPVAGHRGFGQLLQGERSGAGRAAPAAHPRLPRTARSISRPW